MFRITRAEERSKTVLTVEGQLSDESITVVETSCNQARSSGKPVQLYLRNVTSVDQAGQSLLSRLAAGGVSVAATGVYTSYLVETLTGAKKIPGNSHHPGNGLAKGGRGRT